ncbi:unnamed protein product [Arctia plantaginis]|uniref:Uncharacterized protein n=1 Tax=Arctia plantaginis TaxID=874455 RepID=A0A8S1AID8_ARCPL|nr:unnamed protein product [Arctia plantaginis]CAB3260455.1 unnamed protein product [Arctia plantaginis]
MVPTFSGISCRVSPLAGELAASRAPPPHRGTACLSARSLCPAPPIPPPPPDLQPAAPHRGNRELHLLSNKADFTVVCAFHVMLFRML